MRLISSCHDSGGIILAYELYKGYIKTKDKKPIELNLKPPYRTYEQVKDLSDFGAVLNDRTLLIDIDSGIDDFNKICDLLIEQGVVFEAYESRKENSGGHILFQQDVDFDIKNKKYNLVCGIEADIKFGSKISLEFLKHKGVEQKSIFEGELPSEFDECPLWLLPIRSKKKMDFSRGSRNNNLFTYIAILQNEGFNKNQIREIIKVVNQHFLDESLPEKEIETILRDEAFLENIFFVKGKLQVNKLVDYLINEHNFIMLNKNLHVFHNGTFTMDHFIIHRIIDKYIPNSRLTQRNEIQRHLELKSPTKKFASERFVLLKNGIFDLMENKLIDFDPDLVILNQMNVDYVAEAYCKKTDDFLNHVSNGCQDTRKLLEEMIGYSLLRRNELRKSFILVGGKATGKSTFLHMLLRLHGTENVSSLDLAEINERFSKAALFGKTLNIGDDIDDDYIRNTATLKKAVSGEPIKGEFKGKDGFYFIPYCKLIFSANAMPRIRNNRNAVLDRLVIIPFEKTYDEDDFDPYLKDKLTTDESLSYLLNLGLKALNGVQKRQGFTIPKSVAKKLEEFELDNDPILQFIQEITEDDYLNESNKKVYKDYKNFCSINGYNPVNLRSFSIKFCSYLKVTTKLKSVKGVRNHVYIKK